MGHKFIDENTEMNLVSILKMKKIDGLKLCISMKSYANIVKKYAGGLGGKNDQKMIEEFNKTIKSEYRISPESPLISWLINNKDVNRLISLCETKTLIQLLSKDLKSIVKVFYDADNYKGLFLLHDQNIHKNFIRKFLNAVEFRDQTTQVSDIGQDVLSIVFDYCEPKKYTCEDCKEDCIEYDDGRKNLSFYTINNTFTTECEKQLCAICTLDYMCCECCGRTCHYSQVHSVGDQEGCLDICILCYKHEVCTGCDQLYGANPCRYCKSAFDDY